MMKTRTVLLIVFLMLILVFAAVNWEEFTRPASLSFLIAEVQAPLGMVMLGLIVVLTAVFIAYALWQQTTMLLEDRKHSKEMHAQRELAERAEASRISELRELIAADALRNEERARAMEAATLERLDRMERQLLAAFEESGNSVAASIGELDDHIVRQMGSSTRTAATPPVTTVASTTQGPGHSPLIR